jgi:hypothetical protein
MHVLSVGMRYKGIGIEYRKKAHFNTKHIYKTLKQYFSKAHSSHL